MAQILSKDVKEVVYRKTRKLEGIECDICHRELRCPCSEDKKWVHMYPKYFEVTTGHNDWGNDSIDSIEHRDICPECVSKFVSCYLQEANGTEYIEIETKHYYPRDIYTDDE